MKAAVNLDDVTICLSKSGYRDLMKLADNFSAFNQRLKYAHFRPFVPVKSDPRLWWKYAYSAVSNQMKKASVVSELLVEGCLEIGPTEPPRTGQKEWDEATTFGVVGGQLNDHQQLMRFVGRFERLCKRLGEARKFHNCRCW
ncbi:hypothetical protein L6452_40118 [Arctium lappa]|uniref:Uncharacterized protein n=1 Tax=Arctium lappa TaxID=4217 RepID=A0ACB8XLU2_ARCLA|nr:hypothetical protein L6452_40118 [Arctium lappa]